MASLLRPGSDMKVPEPLPQGSAVGDVPASQPLRVTIFHHTPLLRQCLVEVMSRTRRFTAREGDHTDPHHQQRLAEERPDAIVVDLRLPEGFAGRLVSSVREHGVPTKILLLASEDSQESLFECVASGIHGVVSEQSALNDLVLAIERVVRGEPFCSPEVLEVFFEQIAKSRRPPSWRERAESASLTDREWEVLELISEEKLGNKQIARRLSISLYTVKNHVHNILEKLQVEDRHHAARWAGSPR